MSLTANIDLFVHVHDFKAQDSLHQRFYTLRYTFCHSQSKALRLATPIYALSLPHEHSEFHDVVPTKIDDQLQAFQTRVFMIRRPDETVILDDTALFRFEIEVSSSFLQTPIFMRVQLCYVDEEDSTDSDNYSLIVLAEENFKVASPLKGCQEFIPIVFCSQEFLVANTSLYITMTDFKINVPHVPIKSESIDMIEIWTRYLFHGATSSTYIGVEAATRACGKFFAYLELQCNTIHTFLQDVMAHFETQLGVKTLRGPEIEKLNAYEPRSGSARELAEEILKASKASVALASQCFFEVQNYVKKDPQQMTKYLNRRFVQNTQKYNDLCIFREDQCISELSSHCKFNIAELHSLAALKYRESSLIGNPELPVESILLYENCFSKPLLFQETYGTSQEVSQAQHLIILVHGYKGRDSDLDVLKHYLRYVYPDHHIYSSKANVETDCCIDTMGLNLAQEIRVLTCDDERFNDLTSSRISFVCQSLGGLVVRAALPYLDKLKLNFYSYISLFSPHLGCFGSSNGLVNAGMWVLRRFTHSPCLDQLSLSDAEDLHNTFLYTLSCLPGLNWFKNVVLISSIQDGYVPLESARIEICQDTLSTQASGEIYLRMAENILSSLVHSQVCRINVDLNIKVKNIDSVIGRTAHMQFVENQSLIRMLVYSYPQFFK
mmetsp:Transcript_28794/g.51242  ORF Transcript_28794/g.51242 Transcript_28794/m.51242 type:complete len:664 (+) Transcript_28794:22-2013(+)